MSVAYQKSLSSLSIIKQPASKGGLANADPPVFEITADNNRVNFDASGLPAGTDASYVGNIIECVEASALSANNLGCFSMVKAWDSGGTSMTCDGFPDVPQVGDKFRMYTTPDAKFVCTTAGIAATTIVCAGRTEAIDYWNGTAAEGGPYLEAVRVDADETPGDYHPLITDWAFAGTTVTVDAITPWAKAVGDFFRAMRHIDITSAALVAEEQAPIIREQLIGADGRAYSVPGRRTATAALDMVFRGPGDTRDGMKAEAHDLLDCVFTSVDVADSVTAAHAHDLEHIVTAAATSIVGRMQLTPYGDAFMPEAITAPGGTEVFVSPHLRHACAAAGGETILGGFTYTPAQLVRYGLTAYSWDANGIETDAYGGVPSFTISGAKGEQLKLGAAVQFADWYRRIKHHTETVPGTVDPAERLWTPKKPTGGALRSRDMRFVIDESIDLGLTSFELKLGPELTNDLGNLCAPNETDGSEILSNAKPVLTAVCRIDSDNIELLRDLQSRRRRRVFLQAGAASGHPGIIAWWCDKAEVDAVPIQDDGGQLSLSIEFHVVRDEAGVAAGRPIWALGIW